MKLAVPLTAPGEAALLYGAGATEFYCGLQTPEWQEAFGDHDSISRRQGAANLSALDTLNTLVAESAKLDSPIFLTVNGSYTREQLPMAAKITAEFEDMGGTGIMVADIGLLSLLKKKGSKLIRGLSLLAAAGSSAALTFYRALGVTRVVFPRFLQPGQISVIMKAHPNVQAECIVWLDKCRCIDGYCRFLHAVGYRDAPDNAGNDLPTVFTHDTTYQWPACFELFGKPPALPACAACSLRALAAAGVTVFKMGGRGRPIEPRLTGARFLSLAYKLAGVDTGGDADYTAIKEEYARLFGRRCEPSVCYYAESAGVL
ncbi:MAG: U32 family peptidase [Clostridiales bacterium]|jgi:collagenase-like PrtC family protease|nr:U32 family peptidase [Clostridiales bacterium]